MFGWNEHKICGTGNETNNYSYSMHNHFKAGKLDSLEPELDTR